MGLRKAVKGLPAVGGLVHRLCSPATGVPFEGSAEYWERRYLHGGNSGAGSFNLLARFKADILNNFVAERRISSVIEFGCGDGAQLELAEYPIYTGVDISPTVLSRVRHRFSGRHGYRFLHIDDVRSTEMADLSLSLDVIYHLVEDKVYSDHMTSLFDAAMKAVIVYSSNTEQASNAQHVRHRRFTSWVALNRPDFVKTAHIPNMFPFDPRIPDRTSFADFYVYERRV